MESFFFKLGLPWWAFTLIGALSLTAMNSIKKLVAVSPVNWLFLLPLLALCDIGFWTGFRMSNSFIATWFLGSAFTATLGLTVGLLFFDKVFVPAHIFGTLLIIVGAFLLVK